MPLQLTFPAEGTGYEIGGMAIVKGAKNLDNRQSVVRLGAASQHAGTGQKVPRPIRV